MTHSDKILKNKEQEILAAAEVEFMTRGYAGARITRIAQAAGVTHAMLIYYFRSKECLFNRILEDKIQLMIDSLSSMLSCPAGTVSERIESFLSIHFDFFVQYPLLPRFVIQEVIPHPERMEKIRVKIFAFLSQIEQSFGVDYQKEVTAGRLVDIELQTLFFDIVSLNLFVFVSLPLASALFRVDSLDSFLQKRKTENIALIMKRIQR